MAKYYPEGSCPRFCKNGGRYSEAELADAAATGEVLQARAMLCDSGHDLLVDLGCMRGRIPRQEGAVGVAEGRVRDISMIARVNKPVSFVVEKILYSAAGEPTALLSRRAAQQRCIDEYLQALCPGEIIPARVTHMESFGAFVDVGCGVASLLPIDAISVSRIAHPQDRFCAGQEIYAVVTGHDPLGRLCLSHKELLGTWEENAALFSPGQTVSGVVRTVESYGIFVELSPNLAGLSEAREGVRIGQQASVYIKSFNPARMKVKLILIDAFDAEYAPAPPHYFHTAGRIDRWLYSPPDCARRMETVFLEN